MSSIDPTPFLVHPTPPETTAETVRAAGLRQAARMIRRASTSRRAMREPSMAVRETAAREIEDRQVDWAYSRPVVVLDAAWNTAFVAAAAAALFLTRGDSPKLPLRLWIVGYAVQCLVHVVCVCVAFRRRQRRRSLVVVDDVSEDLAEESSSFIQGLEAANTMFPFVWWFIGVLWLFAGGNALQQDSPMLY
ncbi:hypothetical protein RND81_06G238900 [Saponaria officinalis]|uniref:RING-type E3 ubiquitin transferase n=1 Tax=Saponaria officinalis TaxID=3572 RepID=A0AAW1KF26_SAPOF